MMRKCCVVAGLLLLGCGTANDPADVEQDGGADAPDGAGSVSVEWPDEEPIPSEFDFPPWLNMPEHGRIVVSWRAANPVAGSVRLWSDTDDEQLLPSPAAAHLHHVDLGELAPATGYQYEVSIEGAVRRGAFVTPGADRWRFIHVAEFHAPGESANVARFASAIREFRPHVLIESGDMADTGTDLDHWRDYLHTSAPWISNVILIPAHSNHVNGLLGNANLLDLFVLPGNERWYRTRYGQVEIFSLDSTYDTINPDIPAAQVDWVAAGLRETQDGIDDPLLVIGAWHYPACSSNYASRASRREWVMDHFVDTMVNDIDLILVGHDKYYERSLIDNRIPHLMTNAGKLSPSSEGSNHERCTAVVTDTGTHSLGLFEVDGATMTATVIDGNGATLDQFSIGD